MITAGEIIRKYNGHRTLCMEDLYDKVSPQTLIEYAREAIKEDRKNVAEYAELYGDENSDFTGIGIDKDSIINAPNIELK